MASAVFAQEMVAVRTLVGHLLHTAHAAGDAGTWPQPHDAEYEAEYNPHNPGRSRGPAVGGRGDILLTVGASHRHRCESKAGRLDAVHLSDDNRRWLGLSGVSMALVPWGKVRVHLVRRQVHESAAVAASRL